MTLGDIWSCYSETDFAEASSRYRDVLGVKYAYDREVPNHKNIKAGDILVIRDGEHVFGFGWVQEVQSGEAIKRFTLCPECRLSGPSRRSTKTPAYRCKRGHVFDAPTYEDRETVAYEAWYDATWAPLAEPLPKSTLDPLYAGADRQNSVRRLDPVEALQLLRDASSLLGAAELDEVAGPPGDKPPADPAGGHALVPSRRRIGQDRFRERLRDRFGDTCAITGSQPVEVLDAAHLYVFAEHPEHHLDGGLLLRSDIHRLFDAFKLTIDPETWTVRLAPELSAFESLRALEGADLVIPADQRPNADWLSTHRDEAVRRWRGGMTRR